MKLAECFQKDLLKRTSPDMDNAIRSLELSKSNIEDAALNILSELGYKILYGPDIAPRQNSE